MKLKYLNTYDITNNWSYLQIFSWEVYTGRTPYSHVPRTTPLHDDI